MHLKERLKRVFLVYDSYLFLRYRLEWLAWELKGRPVPPPPLVKQRCVLAHQRQFNLQVMIETGTYRGAMVRATRRVFREVYSIELSPELHERARQLFVPFSHIHLLQGDSGVVLREVLPRLHQPCLFWLDAHHSGVGTALGERETPILAELDGILAHPVEQHVILIDDARQFNGEHAYPTLEKLTCYVRERRPEWQVSVAKDIIRITPQDASGDVKWGKRVLRRLRTLMAPVADPVYMLRGVAGYARFLLDWRRYARLPQAEPMRWADAYPQVHDRTRTTAIDAHYFYMSGWAVRRIHAVAPRYHVDVASHTIFASLLGGIIPTVFVDYRPLMARMSGLQPLGGSLLNLPFANGSIASLSCLHVIEHAGLGRYGDPLDPQGTRKAVCELVRVLAPGGHLFLSTPVGRPRMCFNAHRIHAAEAVRAMAAELELVEFSGVTDEGRYIERVGIGFFDRSDYACGFFWLRRPALGQGL